MFLIQIQKSSDAAATATQQNPHSILPLIIFFGVIPLAFMLYCLRDILPKTYAGNGKKIWMTLIIILPMLGPLLYLFIGQEKALR
ncbi:PLD nuclease N-terminal domain-containing protein [Arachidicoccus terrestris]|uniref:PLD nuclease N-terminal domain-containing protein n=1 Tax=Arachidicoccus terrestris TaxID=2875539 RepID=UPI001CC40650|nr:PLD nuclease N-terminal domain-containing protein [Arachidicoccus terrestris]UAY54671.1 PLD nuclease N-terminal domain-containing protein [Arachidicoccus terrestris]